MSDAVGLILAGKELQENYLRSLELPFVCPGMGQKPSWWLQDLVYQLSYPSLFSLFFTKISSLCKSILFLIGSVHKLTFVINNKII